MLPAKPKNVTTIDNLDLTKPPKKDGKWKSVASGNPKEIILGDLNGCPELIANILCQQGLIEISEDNYRTLVEENKKHLEWFAEYKKDDTDRNAREYTKGGKKYKSLRENLDKIKKAIDNIKVTEANKDALLHLIGDVLADRGPNDFITLYLLQHLEKNGLNYRVSLSNHDDYFLREDNGLDAQSNSLINMQKMLDAPLDVLTDKEKDLLEAAKKNYRQRIEPVSYSIEADADGKMKKINICNHAISGPATLKALIEKYKDDFLKGITYKDGTPEELCQTIDAVNKKFKELVQTPGKYEKIINQEWRYIGGQYSSGFGGENMTKEHRAEAPLLFLCWNRAEPEVFDDDKWPTYPDIEIVNYHGHCGGKTLKYSPERENLDTGIGRYNANHSPKVKDCRMVATTAYPSLKAYLDAKKALAASKATAATLSSTAKTLDLRKEFKEKLKDLEPVIKSSLNTTSTKEKIELQTDTSDANVDHLMVGTKSLMKIEKDSISSGTDWKTLVDGKNPADQYRKMAKTIIDSYIKLYPTEKVIEINGKDHELVKAVEAVAKVNGLKIKTTPVNEKIAKTPPPTAAPHLETTNPRSILSH